ncbi:TetR-like C-terminal domain-containing protein [Streptomyces sp. NBC_00344]|uniref:TetR-like C-terminal domain-containing protein n=1 Tax=Streptomyces sp. NBC_00344 TaxID=2975720 RepID=UPI002E215858
MMREFTGARRAALHEVLVRGRERGELPEECDLDLLVDQVYVVFWYRFLLGHEPLDPAAAGRLTASIIQGAC